MNPRVSRSSALASKATGYPIAKVAAKLAVGYTLDEIPNDLTGTTPASFEPTLDYVVVKFPRFAFEKFPGADTTLGTQMKSVGEAMGIGRTFSEAFLKASRSRELDAGAQRPGPRSTFPTAFTPGSGPRSIASRTRSSRHPRRRARRRRLDSAQARWDLGRGDRGALRDERGDRAREAAGLGRAAGVPAGGLLRGRGRGDSNYYYSTWGEADEAAPAADEPRVVILGSGPNRIGQGIEFDYCCVHAAKAFRALGFEAVMVNCNPETVSTDYDTSNRLYFEPLGAEEVLEICARELPDGVVIQFGGQTPLKLARELEAEGWRILGTPFDAVDLAEDRERFAALCDELEIARSLLGDGRGRRARGLRRGGDRLSGPRPALVRARRPQHAGLLRRRRRSRRRRRPASACSSTASSRARSRSTSTRSATAARPTSQRSWSTSRRQESTPATRPACCRRRRSTPETAAEVEDDRAAARSGARRRRPRQRAACGRRRRGLRHRGEPAGLADGALREQGDRHQSRRGRLPARVRARRSPSSTSRPIRRRSRFP